MHKLLLDKVIANCIKRQKEGDNPTEKPFSTEILEDAVIQLYTHPKPIAEIQAEALEKAAEAFTCIAPDINPFYELQNMAAKLRKGE